MTTQTNAQTAKTHETHEDLPSSELNGVASIVPVSLTEDGELIFLFSQQRILYDGRHLLGLGGGRRGYVNEGGVWRKETYAETAIRKALDELGLAGLSPDDFLASYTDEVLPWDADPYLHAYFLLWNEARTFVRPSSQNVGLTVEVSLRMLEERHSVTVKKWHAIGALSVAGQWLSDIACGAKTHPSIDADIAGLLSERMWDCEELWRERR